jgi:DNA-binding CsgD family transcriptional regulator
MFHGTGGLADARRVLEEAEASIDNPVHRLFARADLARLLVYAGLFTEALAIGDPLIGPGMDVRVRLRSLPPVGACMVFAGRIERVLALCDELESDVAFTPPLAETPRFARLTRREQGVATLACHGLSNSDIATRLVLSVRTVESHLYSAYGKLGVSDRTQLATILESQ